MTRREALIATLAAAGATAGLVDSAAAQSGGPPATLDPALAAHAHDWDWLAGRWNVRHHRLKARLAGSTEWEDFNGTCQMFPTMGGFGNVDDNYLELPAGAYRAVGVRAFDPATRQWAIWWLDGRFPTHIDPPVRGSFENGVGTFVAPDTLNNRPIKVRFQWTKITARSAHWEQAYSPDDGASWEVNWRMEFTRA